LERHPAFPNRTNVQFVRVRGRDALDIMIWERGAGWTLASGTSSCAAAVAAVYEGSGEERRDRDWRKSAARGGGGQGLIGRVTAADCSPGQVCEDGTCVAPGCGSNSDCSAGQICSGGDCAPAPTSSSVASCDVTPRTAPVEAGSTVELKALAIGSAGRGLPFAN